MSIFQNYRLVIVAFLILPTTTISAGCEGKTNWVPNATGGASGLGPTKGRNTGGSLSKEICGGCAVVTVPPTTSTSPGAFIIQSFRAELIDLSHTTIIYRFWAETNGPEDAGILTLYAINDYIEDPMMGLMLPMASIDVPVSQTSEWLEVSLDLSVLDGGSVGGSSAVGGAGPYEVEVDGVTITGPFDPNEILSLGMMVTDTNREIRVYFDSVTFSDESTADLNYETSAEPSEAMSLFNGVPTELSWLP
jgi:hypothetical protein